MLSVSPPNLDLCSGSQSGLCSQLKVQKMVAKRPGEGLKVLWGLVQAVGCGLNPSIWEHHPFASLTMGGRGCFTLRHQGTNLLVKRFADQSPRERWGSSEEGAKAGSGCSQSDQLTNEGFR